jgi:pimeloyl-ACP methyl ester carboxylesterase
MHMTQLFKLVLILSLVIFGGCYVPPGPVETDDPWLEVDPATGRAYYLYIPTTYNHNKPAPVIVSCHGTPPYDVARHHIDTWRGYGEKYGCIIIAPTLDGTDGIFGDGPVSGMMVNERNILSILSGLSYKYNLDRSNIMITGFSGGGFPAYWVGLRHPDVFTVIVAQNCNFNRAHTDGWYPLAEARKMPVMIYYGEHDPGTIIDQSRRAIEYLRSRGFRVDTDIIAGAGHDRHPEVAMDYFRRHWKTPRGTLRVSRRSKRTENPIRPRRYRYRRSPSPAKLRGPRPPRQ